LVLIRTDMIRRSSFRHETVVKEDDVTFIAPLCAFALGSIVGGVGGIIIGFAWYEHKCGLFSDHNGARAAGIRFELDDVFGRPAISGGDNVTGRRKLARFMFH
jgi:hypothetical protein